MATSPGPSKKEEDSESLFIPIDIVCKELGIRPEHIYQSAETVRTLQWWKKRGLPGHKFLKFYLEWYERERRWRPGEGRERMERILEQVANLVRNEDGDTLRMIHILLDAVVGEIPEEQKAENRKWVQEVLSQAQEKIKSRGGGARSNLT